MATELNFRNIANWAFGSLVFVIGILNLMLVHPVPGIAYILLSLIYLPPATEFINRKLGFSVPALVKIALGIFIMWFTLGISDLAEIAGL